MPAQKKLEFPHIPVMFPGRFPKGHVNDAKGWNFNRKELMHAAEEGRMLTMDLDIFGDTACSLRCPHCFNPVLGLRQKNKELLPEKEMIRVLREAKALGLRSVKIIGPGEPLEEKSLFRMLDFLAELDIQPLIFTKATALGNNTSSRRVHGVSSDMLAKKLRETYGASILLGATSFHPETEERIVGRGWYPAVRNMAMERLVDAGFNEFTPGQPTSLALIFNPILRQNVDEVFEVYKWSRLRHIYVVSAPSMIAGSCKEEKVYEGITPSADELLEIYVKINVWAIKRGIYTFEDVERDGISAYAGAAPCQQVGAGLFVRRDGLVFRCPGDDVSIQGKISEESMAGIWRSSENFLHYRGMINVGCPPKIGKTILSGLFDNVLERLREILSGIPG